MCIRDRYQRRVHGNQKEIKMGANEGSPTYSKEDFYKALHMVESSGSLSPPAGDGGRSIGPFQIMKVYHLDSNISEPYEKVMDLSTAKKCLDGYMNRYSDTWSNSMSLSDVEKCARIHNGGPSGYKKSVTEGYWSRFKSYLQ
eukprot:TRINITY_DN16868_c0_g1_i1.p1 TRINITY_DN16868_c0_g1~~TRINITY_DN16868_c0_g1_i1.p1  ORF type:complete len:142 (-),score=21.07 TRINITY_DN16868_c0_g1_i1:192-617(-)